MNDATNGTKVGRLDELVGAVPVERNQDGSWLHPGVPWNEVPEGVSPHDHILHWGYECASVSMDGDVDGESMERYFDAVYDNFRFWEPSRPAGHGWFLGAIYDTEDGPESIWLRPNTLAQEPNAQSEAAGIGSPGAPCSAKQTETNDGNE